jgi:hypothetical protein
LIWAAFGSGKTHALKHIECLADEKGGPAAAYVVVPQGIHSFLDIFRAVVDSLLEKRVLDVVGQELLAGRGPNVASDVERAVVRAAIGSVDERRLATAWLRGDRLPQRDVRSLGLSRRIETVTDAVQALNDLIGAIYRYRGPVILLLDEVQELEELGRKLPECIGGLHKLFDLNPRGLTLVFSFTTGFRTTVRTILGEALFDRAADVIALPPLTANEAVDFVTEVISTWSLDKSLVPAPFAAEAIRVVVDRLDDSGTALTPRVLMKAFDQILREGEYDISLGEIGSISAEYAIRALDSMTAGELE